MVKSFTALDGLLKDQIFIYLINIKLCWKKLHNLLFNYLQSKWPPEGQNIYLIQYQTKLKRSKRSQKIPLRKLIQRLTWIKFRSWNSQLSSHKELWCTSKVSLSLHVPFACAFCGLAHLPAVGKSNADKIWPC